MGESRGADDAVGSSLRSPSSGDPMCNPFERLGMAQETIEYFYSVRSSFTYLGAARLNALSARFDAPIRHYPMDLGAVIAAYNDLHDPRPADREYAGARAYEKFPARERYTQIEYRRWSDYLGVPIVLDPVHHYGSRELPSGVIVVAQERGLSADRLSHDILEALWRHDRDIADESVIAELIEGAGVDIDSAELIKLALSDETKSLLSRNTKLAVERGVFGAPFYIYRNEPFFGQDRLFFLEIALNDGAACA